MNKVKIGIFTRPIDQGTSGSGHHLKEIVTHILKQNKDFDITLIHYAKNNKEIYNGVKELIIPRNPLRASKIIKKESFDLLHYSPLTIMAPIWGISARKVATIHGAEPDLVPQYYSIIKRLHSKYIMPIYARLMDHIFTVSNTSKTYFVDTYKIPSEKISITYNAVNKAFKKLDGNDFEANRKYSTGDKFIFHISKCSHRKNPVGIIKSFSIFAEKYNEFKLVLAGSGWNSDYVKELLIKTNILHKTVFPGFVAEQDVIELLNTASIFIFPSYAEGFGIPNIEAMSCGCPAITSGVFALPEIVDDAAIIVKDPEDHKGLASAMENIVEDNNLRNNLIDKGFNRSKFFSWEKSANHILETYKKILK